MEESKLCEICKEKPATVSLWKDGRIVKICVDCYREDGMKRLKDREKV